MECLVEIIIYKQIHLHEIELHETPWTPWNSTELHELKLHESWEEARKLRDDSF